MTPTLEYISKKLNMSEVLSGVTLLAFANGAPDVMASFSAGGEEDGISLSIGALFGASLFCCTVVLGMRIYLIERKMRIAL